jgi:predicted acetylornithine/succinylornithine family transaminase
MSETIVAPAKAVAAAPAPAAAPPAAPPKADAGAAADLPAPAFAHDEVDLLAPLYPLPRLELVEGHGARVRDAGGREYLDFTSGIAVNAFGHAPRGLAEAIASQLARLGHCSNLFANTPALALAHELTEATGYERVFFCNSGTEGNDAALKFARARAHRLGLPGRAIVAFKGGFHGRTGFALSATHTPSYREPFEPLVPGVRFADFNDAGGLDHVLDRDVCAVIVECVQGESGAVPGTRDFLQALRARCTALGALLIVDEVQTGMGRTGRLLAQEHFDVRGDLVVMSKALGAGLPIAAVLMTADVAKALAPGMHGCTFGGNAVCAAAARWSLAQVRRPAFLERVRRAARKLAAGLEALVAKHAFVREARGLGLLRAIDLAPGTIEPAALVAAAREAGLLLVRGGERAVRVLPPLTVTDAEIDDGLGRLDAALASCSQTGGSKK